MADICFVNPNYPGCKSKKKVTETKTSFCTAYQYDCLPSVGTFYTECGGFNVGCKVFKLVSGNYVPVEDNFYSDGINGYYIKNGLVQSLGETCPRFFPLTWIKDCLNKDNLSGTWYLTVIDNNGWVPNLNVAYRIPIPVDQTGDCTVAYRSYWVVRFASTTPTYDINGESYIEAVDADVQTEYKLPGFLQDRCSTKAIN